MQNKLSDHIVLENNVYHLWSCEVNKLQGIIKSAFLLAQIQIALSTSSLKIA